MASVRAIKRASSISKSGINCTSAIRFNSASIFQPCDFAFFLIVCSLLRDAGSATSLSSDLIYYRLYLGTPYSSILSWSGTGPKTIESRSFGGKISLFTPQKIF